MASSRTRAKGSDRASGGVDPFYTQTNTPENAVVVFARKARSTIGPGCRFLAPSLARDRGEVPRAQLTRRGTPCTSRSMIRRPTDTSTRVAAARALSHLSHQVPDAAVERIESSCRAPVKGDD